jgi:hypothetical protein
MEIKQGDTSYTCTTMQPPKDVGKPFDGTVIMSETGKVSQRFEVLNLQFQDMNKKALEGKFSLTIQVWPDAFALTLKAIDTTGDMQVTLQANKWTVERCFQGKFDLTLQCNIKERSTNATLNVTTDAINKDVVPQTSNPAMQTRYNASMHAYEQPSSTGTLPNLDFSVVNSRWDTLTFVSMTTTKSLYKKARPRQPRTFCLWACLPMSLVCVPCC